MSLGWIENNIIATPADNAKRPIGIFVRHDASETIPNISIPPDQWVTINLANGTPWDFGGLGDPEFQPDLPEDVTGVFLAGQLIISHPGGAVGTADLWCNFRAPGSVLPFDAYQMHTIQPEAGSGDPAEGVRSNAAVWVPVVNRCFEFYWHFTPGVPSMINLSLQAYTRIGDSGDMNRIIYGAADPTPLDGLDGDSFIKLGADLTFFGPKAAGVWPPGNPMSAYASALAQGFVGTVAEWLTSLHGMGGLDSTVPGPSAYQVAVSNGFVGTELEWLASLQGEPGTWPTGPVNIVPVA